MAGINYALISTGSRALSTQLYVGSSILREHQRLFSSKSTDNDDNNVSTRVQEFRKKLRERAPIGIYTLHVFVANILIDTN